MLTLSQSSGEFMTGNDLAVIVALITALFMFSVLLGSLVFRSVAVQRAREETKRDLAAYIAEGSMRPEDAIEILRSDGGKKKKEAAKRVAEELDEAVSGIAFAVKLG